MVRDGADAAANAPCGSSRNAVALTIDVRPSLNAFSAVMRTWRVILSAPSPVPA